MMFEMGNEPVRDLEGADLLGQRLLDRYRIEERIARGGMSLVFRGWDERLRRPVCVKIFSGIGRSTVAQRTVHDHFVREAYTLSCLNHPNTLRIYDFGHLDDEALTPFQVSELADGGTLRDHIRLEGALPPEAALEVLEPIAGALAEAHDQGVIHRDVKPSNILRCRAGAQITVVKLADFGIAHTTVERLDTEQLPTDEPPLYSLNWAAPEQIRGETVGPEADVYSLALVAAYLLTGRLVFRGQDVLKLFEDRRRGDNLVRELLSDLDVPTSITDVISAACRDDVDTRTPSVETFISALRDAIENQAPEPSRGEPSKPHSEPSSIHFGVLPPPLSMVTTQLTPAFTVSNVTQKVLEVGRRRILVVDARKAVELGGSAGGPASARIRVTVLEGSPGLHIKGLDCFLAREAARPSSGISVEHDANVTLVSSGRVLIGTMRVHLGTLEGEVRVFRLDGATLAVPTFIARWAAVIDAGTDSPAVLLLRTGDYD
jgi:serine/threonine protein kinase